MTARRKVAVSGRRLRPCVADRDRLSQRFQRDPHDYTTGSRRHDAGGLACGSSAGVEIEQPSRVRQQPGRNLASNREKR